MVAIQKGDGGTQVVMLFMLREEVMARNSGYLHLVQRSRIVEKNRLVAEHSPAENSRGSGTLRLSVPKSWEENFSRSEEPTRLDNIQDQIQRRCSKNVVKLSGL